MSYKSREKKRRRHAAEQAQHNNSKKADPSEYYLTFAKKQSGCFRCASKIEKRDEIAFRAEPLEAQQERAAEQVRVAESAPAVEGGTAELHANR
jgi:hypothetical protein